MTADVHGPLLRWPDLNAETDPAARTTLTCGHFGLLARWEYPAVGARQRCEVCGESRTVVEAVDL